uniref:MSP domain-containing protein n=1 Tax=Brassica campestris TaxID=3711 RepID=A0A3P5Y152_BRACM|nr:unnamed protein product [Brassica rapa]
MLLPISFYIDHHVNLQFPFESGKQIYSSLYLVTMTDNYVAFTVKTTTPKTCCVRPSIGVVPRSSSELLVTMQVQKEAPADMQCKNNFLLQLNQPYLPNR